jgi:hypothetical protein
VTSPVTPNRRLARLARRAYAAHRSDSASACCSTVCTAALRVPITPTARSSIPYQSFADSAS